MSSSPYVKVLNFCFQFWHPGWVDHWKILYSNLGAGQSEFYLAGSHFHVDLSILLQAGPNLVSGPVKLTANASHILLPSTHLDFQRTCILRMALTRTWGCESWRSLLSRAAVFCGILTLATTNTAAQQPEYSQYELFQKQKWLIIFQIKVRVKPRWSRKL